MFNRSINVFIASALIGFPVFTFGDCVAIAFRTGEEPINPVYRILSCRPAKEVVDQFRDSNPNWYGNIQSSAKFQLLRCRSG
jgi:hypothetical protein